MKSKYKYFDPRKGGIVKEAQQLPSISRKYDLPFVSLEILDTGQYRIWAGNEKRISIVEFFTLSHSGLETALSRFEQLRSSEMTLRINNEEQEKKRLLELFTHKV